MAEENQRQPSATPAEVERLFGASDMGARILAFDWAATPLGPIAGWEPALTFALSTMLAAQAEVALMWGPEHVFFYNDCYAQALGDRHPQALGRPARETWAVRWAELGPPLEQVMQGESIAVREYAARAQRGGRQEEVFVDVSMSPVRDGDGAVAGALVIMSNTTDRVRALQGVLAARERRGQMFEQAPGCTALLREPGHVFEFVNAAFRQLVGERGLIGRGVAEALPELTGQGVPELLDGVVESGLPFTGRTFPLALQRTADGPAEERLLNFVYQPIRDERGEIDGIFIQGGDVTGQVRAEERLALSEGALRLATEVAGIGTWDVDVVRQTVVWNDQTKAMFGISPDQPYSFDDFYAGLHPDDRAATVTAFTAQLDPGLRTPYDVEYRTVGKEDGVVRWVAAKGTAFFEGDICIRAIGTAIDITATHRAAEALERGIAERTSELAASNQALSRQIEERERVEATLRQMQRLEAIGQLTSGVAHDFNNLLTVVLGNVDMVARAARGSGLDERTLRRLGTIRTAAERGATLTGQLLAFSRRQRLEARPIDLNGTVAGMRDLLQSSMGGSVRLEMRLADTLWPALVDPTQIELIVLNLAINARDAMQVGGMLSVETANVMLGEPGRPEEPAPGEYVMIAVADSGTGMTPEVLAKAFEPFFTTKEIGKGSGLGLAQVYGFATQSGGGVGIETELGRGTTVRVYLPRAAREAPEAAVPPAPHAGTPHATGRRILVVDDDPAVREVTAATLLAIGARVTEAGSGAQALEELDEAGGAYDLMVADFAMPGMNGAELAAAAAARWPVLPVLYVTGYADLTAIASVSTDLVVQKPFRSEDLQRRVASLLGTAG